MSHSPTQRLLIRAGDVELRGAMRDAAFEEQQWLVQRRSQFVQLTELLYRILEHADGQRTAAEIADAVTASSEWLVTSEIVESLAATRLLPARLAQWTMADVPGADRVPHKSAASALDVRLRAKMISPKVIEPVTRILQHLFSPLLLLPLLLIASGVHAWAYLTGDVSGSVAATLYTPGGLLLTLAVLLVGSLIHELGHAAALFYGGGEVRGIGVGLYLIFPAFYTDVTDGYRLGRAARVRTDLGGVYFHAIFASVLMIVAAATGNQLLFFSAMLVDIEIARQFIPFVRLDGYWLLTDLTGVPDFFSQMKPFVRSLSGKPQAGAALPQLRPMAKYVFLAYIVTAIPVLAFLFGWMLIKSPALFLAARDAFATQVAVVVSNEAIGTSLLAITQMLLVALPAVGTVLIVMTVFAVPVAPLAARMSPQTRRVSGNLTFATAASLVLVWLSGSTGAQGFELDTAIAQARNAVTAVNSLQADVEGLVGSDRYTGTLALQRPNLAQVNIEGSEGLGRFRVTSNGLEVLMYFPEGNQFSRSRPGADGGQITAFVVAPVRHFFNPAMLAQGGEDAVAQLGADETLDGETYRVIEVVNSKTARTSRYFVSRRDGLVHRIVYQRPSESGGVSEEYVQLRNIRVNAPMPETTFAWTLPEGATVLQMPAGVDLSGARPPNP